MDGHGTDGAAAGDAAGRRTPRHRRGWTALLLAAALLGVPPRAMGAPLVAYDEALRNGFADWSWASRNLTHGTIVHAGAAAIAWEPDGWQGLYLHRDAGMDPSTYEAVELWVHGGSAGGQSVTVAVLRGGSVAGSAPLAGFVAGGAVPAGVWARARVPFDALGVTAGVLDGVWLQDATGGDQPTLYVDDVVVLERTTPPPPPAGVSVTVDPAADRHPVSPRIFGVNFGDAQQLARLRFPSRRWGGNATTRYSWVHDVSNRASDWFFYNVEDGADPGTLPHGSSADRFIDEALQAGSAPIVTVPLIGWTPIDRTRRWGFSVAKYGAQQQTECTATGGASWCNPDAGNGLRPDGSPVTGNDPRDTSRPVDPSFVTGWMAHIASRVGTAAQGGVRYFTLDNEPTLWSHTHRDVHPQPLTFDELWQRTRSYAAAIKAQDPAAVVLGPSPWGWCAYFGSGADACADGPDRQAHGGLALLDWYLQQVAADAATRGFPLVDVLDVHYYPQAPGVALSDDESAATAAVRLRSLRSLYDPAYVDESWIGQPVRLVPRMKAWIAARLPGTRLAITEYSWGNDDGPTSALAQAEALAIFAREDVEIATRWVAPAPGSRVEDAFRLYLDYDGAGARVAGTSVRATSSDVDAVGAYAVQADDGRLFLLLFNKDTAAREVGVRVAGGAPGPATLYRFSAASRLGPAGTVAPAGGVLTVPLPARSASLAVLPSAGAPAGDADGDGVPDATDVCPAVADPAQADADGDGLGDPCDTVCPAGVALTAAKVVLALRPGGGDTLSAKGVFVAATAPDPVARGVRVRLESRDAALLDAHPGGPGAATPFRARGGRASYTDRTGAAGGIVRVALKPRGGQTWAATLKVRNVELPAVAGAPLRLLLDWGPPCAETRAATFACTWSAPGTTVRCAAP